MQPPSFRTAQSPQPAAFDAASTPLLGTLPSESSADQSLESLVKLSESELRSRLNIDDPKAYSIYRYIVEKIVRRTIGQAISCNLDQSTHSARKAVLEFLLSIGAVAAYAGSRANNFFIKVEDHDDSKKVTLGQVIYTWRTRAHWLKEEDFKNQHPITIPAHFTSEERSFIETLYRQVPNHPPGTAMECRTIIVDPAKKQRVMDLLVLANVFAAWRYVSSSNIVAKVNESDILEGRKDDPDTWRDKSRVQRESLLLHLN